MSFGLTLGRPFVALGMTLGVVEREADLATWHEVRLAASRQLAAGSYVITVKWSASVLKLTQNAGPTARASRQFQ